MSGTGNRKAMYNRFEEQTLVSKMTKELIPFSQVPVPPAWNSKLLCRAGSNSTNYLVSNNPDTSLTAYSLDTVSWWPLFNILADVEKKHMFIS